MSLATLLLGLAQAWGWTGAFVALAFLAVGIDRLDADARGAYPFRLLLVPGVLLIWPLVLWRWFVLATGRDDPQARHRPPRRLHRWAAPALLAAIVSILTLGLSVRPDWPADTVPVRLSEADR